MFRNILIIDYIFLMFFKQVPTESNHEKHIKYKYYAEITYLDTSY